MLCFYHLVQFLSEGCSVNSLSELKKLLDKRSRVREGLVDDLKKRRKNSHTLTQSHIVRLTLTHPPTYSINHPLTHSYTYSLTIHSLNHPLTHTYSATHSSTQSHTQSFIHSPINSLTCLSILTEGDFRTQLVAQEEELLELHSMSHNYHSVKNSHDRAQREVQRLRAVFNTQERQVSLSYYFCTHCESSYL